VSPSSSQTSVTNLLPGVYQFQLTVTDDDGAVGTDLVIITLNQAGPPPPNQLPVANAGVNQSITLPTNSLTLNGSGTDADGIIVGYNWTKIAGPTQFTIITPNAAQTTVNNLVQGVYQLQLQVTDNAGAIAKDTVTITVNPGPPPPPNQLPVANAGTDQSITLPTNSVTLSGSGTDADGTIVAYSWIIVSGPAQFTIVNAANAQTVVNSLVQGVYKFRLQVTDNAGGTGRDTVTITVNAGPPPPNQPPVANAGSNQSITLPTNSVILSGSGTDPDGAIVSYTWLMISGPAQFTIVNPANSSTTVNNLVQGVYQFQLQVTDNSGATGRDTVMVTVNPSGTSNQPPVANAGNDIAITLPINSGVLNGSGTDADGSVVAYSWTKIAGPSQFSILSPSLPQTIVNNLTQGTYSFELKVTDNAGAIGRDTVQVIVNSAANRLPVAEAGDNKVIFLPTDTVTLDGHGDSPDGAITNYNWRKLDGPGQSIVMNPSSAETIVADLVEGTYDFEFTVTDNFGAIAKDTVTVLVKTISESKVSIYPNPTTSIINIKIDAKTHTNLTLINIYDVNGRRLYTETFLRSDFTIVKQVEMSGFASGTYFVEVTADINHRVTNKVIKQ
jgi:ribosomal protein L14